jgi:hypothetical protein
MPYKNKIKQYIVLRHDITPSVATIACAHGVLAAYLKWQDDQIVKDWISGLYGPFYKVICQASDAHQWRSIQLWENYIPITESKLDNLRIALVFKPQEASKGSIFNDLKLYS